MLRATSKSKAPNRVALWSFLILGVAADIGFGKRVVSADLERGVYARPLTLAWVAGHGQPCAYLATGGDTSYVESAAGRLLAQADQRGYEYLRTHRITVVLVPGNLLQACEHTAAGLQSFSANLVGTEVVLLNRDRLLSDAAKAAALSHEMVHVRYGDDGEPSAHRTLLSQLWLSEEGEAHRRGLDTSETLHAHGLPGRISEDLNYIYALQVDGVLCAVLLIGACLPLLLATRKSRTE